MTANESWTQSTRMLQIMVIWLTLFGQTTQNDGNVILEDMTWGEGYTACRERGLKLLNSIDMGHTILVEGSGKHWIGLKVMYSSWKWTADSTKLFAYVGYHNTTTNELPKKNLEYDNEAVRCYLECNTKYLGLQGSNCFCFNSAPPTTTNTEEETCLGNSEELCGTPQGMSVYRADLLQDRHPFIKWTFKPEDICGYVHSKNGKFNVKTENDCGKRKRLICSCTCSDEDDDIRCVHDVCYDDRSKLNWFSSSNECSLVKLDGTNAEWINEGVWNNLQYWIGLKRFKYVGWSDRAGVISNHTETSKACIAAEKFLNGSVVFYASPCDDRKKAICTKGEDFQTMTTPAIIRTTYSGTTHSVTTEPSTDNQQHSSSEGAIVGAVLAVVAGVIALAAVGAVVWMKRNKRQCFKDEPTKHDIKRSLSNEIIVQPSTNEHETPYYSEINEGFKHDDSPIYTYVTAAYEFEHPPIKPRPQNEYLELIPEPYDVPKSPTVQPNQEMGQHIQEMNQSNEDMGQHKHKMGQHIQEMNQSNQEMGQHIQERNQNNQEMGQHKHKIGQHIQELTQRLQKIGQKKQKMDQHMDNQKQNNGLHMQVMDQQTSLENNNELTSTEYSTPYANTVVDTSNVNFVREVDKINQIHRNNKSAHLKYNTPEVYELAGDPNGKLKEETDESDTTQTNQFSHSEYIIEDTYELAENPDDHITEDSCVSKSTESNIETSHAECSSADAYELAGDPNTPQTNKTSSDLQFIDKHEHDGYNCLHANNHPSNLKTCNTRSYDHIVSSDCSKDTYDRAGHSNTKQRYDSSYNHIDVQNNSHDYNHSDDRAGHSNTKQRCDKAYNHIDVQRNSQDDNDSEA